MSEMPRGNYQSMENSDNRVQGRFFYIFEASETKNAYKKWISLLTHLGHVAVEEPENADYFLVFCPVKSRIKTDIDEALEKIPGGKPVILVVMHHTFNKNAVIMESRRQVTRGDVRLTVDCLFYEGQLLSCNINDIASNKIQNCLGVPASVPNRWSQIREWLGKKKKLVLVVVVCILVGVGLIVALTELTKH